MKRGHYRHEPAVDLYTPLTDHEKAVTARVDCPICFDNAKGCNHVPAAHTKEPVEPRRPPHEAGCWCVRCWASGLEYADYLQKKRLQEI